MHIQIQVLWSELIETFRFSNVTKSFKVFNHPYPSFESFLSEKQVAPSYTSLTSLELTTLVSKYFHIPPNIWRRGEFFRLKTCPKGSFKLLIMYSSLGLSGPEIMTEWLWLQGSHLRFIVRSSIWNFLSMSAAVLPLSVYPSNCVRDRKSDPFHIKSEKKYPFHHVWPTLVRDTVQSVFCK